MATDYMTSASAFQPQQQHPHQHQQQYSHLYSLPVHPFTGQGLYQQSHLKHASTFNNQPAISSSQAATLSNVQPTSLLPSIRQQSRKLPLYVPAVLRPTEAPVRRQQHHQHHRHQQQHQTTPRLDPASPIATEADLSRLQQHARNLSNATDVSQSSLSRLVSDEWNDDSMGDVTGPPTRNHWKPDASAHQCASPNCTRPFSLLFRRHHCRRCGNIFCSYHSPHGIPLDQHARIHPDGTHQRACDACWSDFRTWKSARSSRAASAANSVATGSDGARTPNAGIRHAQSASAVGLRLGMDSPVDTTLSNSSSSASVSAQASTSTTSSASSLTSSPTRLRQPVGSGTSRGRGPGAGFKAGSFVGSVPRDWNWSTF